MIFRKTVLYTADNSGARLLNCINILRSKSSQRVGYPSSRVIVSIKRFLPNKKVKKGFVYHGILIQTTICARPYERFLGHKVWWSSNRVILLKKNDSSPLSSRVTHFVSAQLRYNNYLRIVSLSLGTL
jgi:ribosomal protein L14